MHNRVALYALIIVCFSSSVSSFADTPPRDLFKAEMRPLLRTIDIKFGETRQVELCDGSTATVKLLEVESHRDSVLGMIDRSTVAVEVNGEKAALVGGNYRLPIEVGGVRIDCPVTGDYRGGEKEKVRNLWNLDADARLRIWPAGSPWVRPGTFAYPIRQRWMATMTWFSNEPVGGNPKSGFYYHAGMDFGGTEGVTEALAAVDGIVVSRGKEVLPGYEPLMNGTEDCEPLLRNQTDAVYLRDARGWYYRYCHLKEFAPEIRPGAKVRRGQVVGLVGKEGPSGGWSHLHFEIRALQPSGRWGNQDGYAFLWQSYIDQYKPKVLAVARPMQRAKTGEQVILDGSRSWAAAGIEKYDWQLSDGRDADGPMVKMVHEHPGIYSEILKVTDKEGNIDYDFAQVRVADAKTGITPATLDANYHPTQNILPGDEITFTCRCIRGASPSEDVWDFGDGTAPTTVLSNKDPRQHAPDGYARVTHRYARPGDYIVTVRRGDGPTCTAMRRMHVRVSASK